MLVNYFSCILFEKYSSSSMTDFYTHRTVVTMNNNPDFYIIKIASGRMAGTELLFKSKGCLIFANTETDYNVVMDEENDLISYFFPIDSGSYKLTFFSSYANEADQSETKLSVIFEDLDNEHNTPKLTDDVKLQTVLFPDTFPILVKSVDDSWNYESFDQTEQKDAMESSLPQQNESLIKRGVSKNLIVIFISMLVVGFILLKVMTDSSNSSSEMNKIIGSNISKFLGESSIPFTIILQEEGRGKDQVIVNNRRDADWVSQQLLTSNYAGLVDILLVSELETELMSLITPSSSSILNIDMSYPCSPIVKLLKSSDHLSDVEKINELIKSRVSCVNEIDVKVYHKKAIFDDAIRGMKASNVPFRVIKDEKKPIVVVSSNLNDNQLISTMDFVKKFISEWGSNYIQFSISLSDDDLYEGVFINDINENIKIKNNHWNFKQHSY